VSNRANDVNCTTRAKLTKQWLKVSEAADLIGVSKNTIRRLVRRGVLKAYQVEGVTGIQFKIEDVLALVKEVEPEEVDNND
jgi:excisionase family DNA binding protein